RSRTSRLLKKPPRKCSDHIRYQRERERRGCRRSLSSGFALSFEHNRDPIASAARAARRYHVVGEPFSASARAALSEANRWLRRSGPGTAPATLRSEERRVGNECRARWR